MIKSYHIIVFLLVIFASCINAQIPSTSLYLVDLDLNASVDNPVKNVSYLSAFNQNGYTNQPSFFSDDEAYVSVRKEGASQNDIYCLNIRNNTVRQVTDTPQSEYSPTLLPDGKSFGCVREILGDQVNQKLFVYPLDQSSNGKNLLPNIPNVGYFSFLKNKEIALFLVEENSKLAVANSGNGETSFLSSNIGRCLRTDVEGQLIYVHKYTDSFWYLKSYDVQQRRASIIDQTLAGKEDFCILPSGSYMMGNGSQLFIHNGNEDSDWILLADLSKFGITNITRLAVNKRSQLIIVDQL